MNRLKAISDVTGDSIAGGVRLVSIASGKGGVGKSVIALNLAERAATAGLRTLLVDADLGCGNLHILANLTPESGLGAFATGEVSLSEAITGCRQNLDLLARSETGPIPSLQGVDDVARFAARVRQQAIEYDLVILDQSSGISDTATLLASVADANLMVLVPELTSISDSYGLCKYLYQANTAIDCRILINRTESDKEAEFVWSRFAAMTEQFLDRVPTLAGSLPEDQAVRRAVASQRLLVEVCPDSDVLQVLTGIVEDIKGKSTVPLPGLSNPAINSAKTTADIRE